MREIQFARTYKQGKIKNWQINEDMYYGRKQPSDTSRANVELGRMQEFVHTLLSKIDNSLVFKYIKRKKSQLKRVQYLNAVRVSDQDEDDWDTKDLAGKKQGAIYGRAIFAYSADSQDGYKAHLDNVDVYDFLIDPSAGGLDIEKARYLGDYGVVYDRSDLEDFTAKDGYNMEGVKQLLDSGGNATTQTQETTNQRNRKAAQGTTVIDSQIADSDKFVFWRWGTTYKGKRYYLLLSETGSAAIRIEELVNVFKSNLWWYWTYAVFLDLTEFWTPSYCDYVREIFMTQNVTVNQAVDNTEQVNKPTKAVNVKAIENLADLKYSRGGNTIRIKGDIDINKAIQILNTPSVDTPLKLFALLEGIQEKASGVTAGAKGVADPDGKATIYEGNQENTADRFGLLNKSYSFGYKRFAKLHCFGVDEHLTKKTAVDIMGPDGVEQVEVSRRDIFRKGESFGVMIEASNAELALSEANKKSKMDFLSAEAADPNAAGVMNPKKSFEIRARIVGFEPDEIRELMDTSDFGDEEIMSEADRDMEALLDGKEVQPNQAANTAYKQRMVDWLRDHQEDITKEMAQSFFDYIDAIEPIIIRNMNRQANSQGIQMQLEAIKKGQPAAPGDKAPLPIGPAAPIAPAPVAPPAVPPDGGAALPLAQ